MTFALTCGLCCSAFKECQTVVSLLSCVLEMLPLFGSRSAQEVREDSDLHGKAGFSASARDFGSADVNTHS